MGDDVIAQALRARELRVTPQRRAILQAFRGRGDEHLSAEEVLSRAAREVPEIGRGTVYATLAELSELGLLASVGQAEPVRYETNLEPHDHFHCRQCLRLSDVDLAGSELRERPLPGYTIQDVAVRAEGVCADCHAYERGLVEGAAHVLGRPTVPEFASAELTCATVDSPVGPLALAASRDGVVRIAFEDHADFDLLSDRARRRRGPVAVRPSLVGLASTLEGYFGGSRARPLELIDWRLSTVPGSMDALVSVGDIAYGEPLSYERLAGGMSAFDVGYTMGSNPLAVLVPCHRVSCGSLRPEAYVGGADRLRILRTLEAG